MRAKTTLWAAAGIALLGLIAFNSASLRGEKAAPLLSQDAPTAEAANSLDDMREAVQAFVATLGSEARAKALIPFEDEERFNWHFTPRERKGLPLKEMNLEQRRAAHTLMQRALSSRGYLKATSIIYLENILKALEGGSPRRDPELYYFTVFGTPSDDAPWGWRVEGHHLSLNYSSATDELATTPAFFGANPAEVRSGTSAGLRILAAEEDLARALLSTLSEEQRARALILAEAPEEIITGAERKARLETYEGLPASAMDPAQREALMRLIHEYTHNMPHDVAHRQLEKIEGAGVENLYFAWAGSFERGEAHYYRIHGPTVLFEYDNTQNDANHVHTVWRDLEDDFGEDLLRRHYEGAGPGH